MVGHIVDTSGHKRISTKTHTIFDGRVQVYRRSGGHHWQCAARVGGRRFRASTHEEALDRAKDVAEEWYLDLRGKLRAGVIDKVERTFAEAAKGYLAEVAVLAATTRSPVYVQLLTLRMNKHLLPYFGKMPLKDINRGSVQAYRVQRSKDAIERSAREGQPGRPPSRSSLTQEIVHLRQTLKWAEGMGWIPFVPNLSQPYMSQGKRGRRAWFSPEEYVQLYTATRRRISEGKRPGWTAKYEDLHDFVLFMANTGLRPDEALRLELRDVSIEADRGTRSTILVIDVRGKTGVGYCKSMPNAVHPFERLKARRRDELQVTGKGEAEIAQLLPRVRLFPSFSRYTFNKILEEEGLKFDREGRRRTAYSLRHTYISMRLMEGANIHQVANNCRTSVQMIEEFYAAHIKDRLDASSINVVRSRSVRKAARKPTAKTA